MSDDTIKLAVDGCWGIYVPQRFFEMYPQFLEHLNNGDSDIISDVNHEHYWDVWDEFTSNFVRVVGPHRWSIYQDSDVFFVRDDHNFDQA
jgi:hypothetical protein